MLYLYLLLLIVGIVFVVVNITKIGKAKGGGLTYKPAAVVTPAEMAFYRCLLQAVAGRYLVWSKLGLWAVVRNEQREGRNKISQKHLDFVLLNPDTLAVCCVIELDDASHNSESAKKRDSEKDAILQSAGIPIIRIKAQRNYKIDQIRNSLDSISIP